MAGGLVLSLEKALLDHVFGKNATYTAPTTIYISLWTTAPDHTGAGGAECSGGSYARLAITNNSDNWPVASGDPAVKANGPTFTFVTPTADWAPVGTECVAWAASSAGSGNPDLAVVPISPGAVILLGGAPFFSSGAWALQFRNAP